MRNPERGSGYNRRASGGSVTLNQNRRNRSRAGPSRGLAGSKLDGECLNVRCIGYLMNRLSAQAFLKPDEELKPVAGQDGVGVFVQVAAGALPAAPLSWAARTRR